MAFRAIVLLALLSLAVGRRYNFPLELEVMLGLPCKNGPAPPGALCLGAEGFPRVDYCGCKGGTCTGPPGKEGYGTTCVAGMGKCHAVGVRCIGAKGYPYVPFSTCCEYGSTCTVKDSKYGFRCSNPKRLPKVSIRNIPEIPGY